MKSFILSIRSSEMFLLVALSVALVLSIGRVVPMETLFEGHHGIIN